MPSRWGSTLKMLTYFIQAQQAVCSLIVGSKAKDAIKMLLAADWQLAEEACAALEATNRVSEILCGGKFSTASYVYPLLGGLLNLVEVCRMRAHAFSDVARRRTLPRRRGL